MRRGLRDIGHDILLAERGIAEPAQLQGRTRFLDCLWLPCSLDKLTGDQIAVINRFREARMEEDAQFAHARTAREIGVHILRSIEVASLLEVGCGKFPLSADVLLSSYEAIEIDSEAISDCVRRGFQVGTLDDFLARRQSQSLQSFDAIIALYAFHFSMERRLSDLLRTCLSEEGVLVFNLIADESFAVLNKLTSLSAHFTCFRAMKSDFLANKEFFFLMGRSSKAVSQAANAFESFGSRMSR